MADSTVSSYEITSPLSSALTFWRMEASERLGNPFQYQIDLLTPDLDVKAEDLLGQAMHLKIALSDGKSRFFHGLVNRVAHLDRHKGFTHLQVELRPWFWFLNQSVDCRIFQEKTIKEIFTAVCKDKHKFSDFKWKTTTDYSPAREYCVQYRESDFEFLCRLLEQEGIYFYFEHEESKHTMILADDYSAHQMIEGGENIPFRLKSDEVKDIEHMYQWFPSKRLQSGEFVHREFDFEKPKDNLETKSVLKRKHKLDALEVYDYPGLYKEAKLGNRYSQVRQQATQADYSFILARGNDLGLLAGGLFKLTEFPRKAENGEYLIVSANITIESSEVEPAFKTTADNLFDAELEVLPGKGGKAPEPFRTPQRTPKPFVRGPQTAIVVGKSGEEIWTDKYGRVKVQFHWDREGKSDEKSSCWVRVAQVWAGANWGAMHIPRMGQEVIVDFLEGDPDQPIITGRVYNKDQMPPYTLPANQTQSGIKTRTTKEGNKKTFNELRFEDKKESEEIYFHAEKDFKRVVENNDELEVGLDKKDEGNQKITIHNNRETFIKEGDETFKIEKGSRTTEINKDEKRTLKTGSRTTEINKNDTLTLKTGDLTTKISAGKGTIQAAKSITLKCGNSQIKMEPTKITIKSAQIIVEGMMSVDAKAPNVTVNGKASLTLDGGTVFIN